MIDETALIARLESADPDMLAKLLLRPTVEEERAYRAYLGDERYQRMHGLALQRTTLRSAQQPRGNVVVIHGIMGGELTAFKGNGSDHVWARIPRLILGRIGLLRLNESGRAEQNPAYQVRATGIMKRHYGELVLSLARNWNVQTFWFDWRRDLNLAAAELEASINRWFGGSEPVHIVAHSMGGLVARTFIRNYPDRWARMWDTRDGAKRGGRLVMLGTPNHGSFAVPQILTGLEGMVRKLALVDLRHSTTDLLRIVNSFPGSYQMLPSPLAYPEGPERRQIEALYRAETYGKLPVSQLHLDAALQFHAGLEALHLRMLESKQAGSSELKELRRMLYVAGYNQPTLGAVEPARVAEGAAYSVTMEGDGRVPHRLGKLPEVPMYYIDESHGELSTNRQIMDALNDLLQGGRTDKLSDHLPRTRAVVSEAEARQRMEEAEREEELLLEMYLRQTRRTRSVAAPRVLQPGADGAEVELPDTLDEQIQPTGDPLVPAVYVSPGERLAEEILTRGFLSSPLGAADRTHRTSAPFAAPQIEIRLVSGKIQDPEILQPDSDLPVSALAVGHYQGVKPAFAELALDRAISAALQGGDTNPDDLADADLLLTQLSERGTLRGDLGQPFILPDPRTVAQQAEIRVVAVAGMGVPGRFGVPELTVLARELVWALGRMRKRHLATVLIGTGVGNLSVDDAVGAWLRGLKYALTGTLDPERLHLHRLTFVELNPQRVIEIDAAITSHMQRYREQHRMEIRYSPLSEEDRQALASAAVERELQKLHKRADELARHGAASAPGIGAGPEPTRVTVGLEGTTYRFGAITASASVPEREIPLDPGLVREANDELLGTWDAERQREHGRFLEKLLVPHDLRGALSTAAPLVLMLDAVTARIHWEMMAQPESLVSTSAQGVGQGRRFDEAFFLGTHRGLTRQLRTIFAPPPEPPPPPRRVLRVLVVADPADDAHLPGAEEEGMAVADLFESFNELYREQSDNRVEVVRLFGPREATRTNVLRHLTLRSYDVLHFAGHCVFNSNDPAASGWIFSRGQIVSARELDRIDRVPNFVFSNACESGITPDRSEMRSAALAPSFAEAFFKRGVVNFVCTAWPVDDYAARTFALELYRRLLGIRFATDGAITRFVRDGIAPEPMYLAMQQARLALARSAGGIRSWGAYQHYGNPNFRFFAAPAPQQEAAEGATTRRSAQPGTRTAAEPLPEPAIVGNAAAPEFQNDAAPKKRKR